MRTASGRRWRQLKQANWIYPLSLISRHSVEAALATPAAVHQGDHSDQVRLQVLLLKHAHYYGVSRSAVCVQH